MIVTPRGLILALLLGLLLALTLAHLATPSPGESLQRGLMP